MEAAGVKRDLVYLSLGAGVQSSALYILSCKGDRGVQRADVAIFADTQGEPAWVYEQLDRLERWGAIPIHRVTQGDLEADARARINGTRSRFAIIPAFTLSQGVATPVRRQCTREYKIQAIEREARRLMGYMKGQRIKHRAVSMIGISADEASRAGISRTKWVTNSYPLLDARLRRSDCIHIIESAGLPVPKKSACVFCPYHSNAYWRDLKENHQHEFERAVSFDEAIRDMTKMGFMQPIYLHRSLIPLSAVDFTKKQGELFDEECAGVCGV